MVSLPLDPGGGVRFYRLHKICDGDGATEFHGEVDVLGDATDAVDFAALIASESSKIGERAWTKRIREPRFPVFRRGVILNIPAGVQGLRISPPILLGIG